MPNYKEMYLLLFRETTKAISGLQRAEELYLSEDTASRFIVINPEQGEQDKQPSQD
jgi:hypothetical protein